MHHVAPFDQDQHFNKLASTKPDASPGLRIHGHRPVATLAFSQFGDANFPWQIKAYHHANHNDHDSWICSNHSNQQNDSWVCLKMCDLHPHLFSKSNEEDED